jgi:hypothetical protein
MGKTGVFLMKENAHRFSGRRQGRVEEHRERPSGRIPERAATSPSSPVLDGRRRLVNLGRAA